MRPAFLDGLQGQVDHLWKVLDFLPRPLGQPHSPGQPSSLVRSYLQSGNLPNASALAGEAHSSSCSGFDEGQRACCHMYKRLLCSEEKHTVSRAAPTNS